MFVREEEVQRWEAGFNGQDVGRSAREAIGCPPLGLVPEGGQFPRHVDGRFEGVGAVAEDWKKEQGGQSVA